MPIPSPIPLDDFEHAVLTDPEVLGVFYFGSLGRGAATGGSDLDIYLWFSADVPVPVDDKLRWLLGRFGEVHWLRIEEGRGFVGPDWTQVDFEFGHGDELDPPATGLWAAPCSRTRTAAWRVSLPPPRTKCPSKRSRASRRSSPR